MAGLTWLHLSDWHQKGKDFDRKVVLEKLLKDIENRKAISPDLEKVDFVVFNGDASCSAQKDEYATTVKDFFDPVLKKLDLGNDRFFIVPGNHDLDRASFKYLPADLQSSLDSEQQVQEWLDNKRGLKSLLEPFESYKNFVESYGEGKFTGYADVLSLKIDGKKVALLGLNSALMSGRNKETMNKKKRVNDYGKLIIGEPQARKALKKSAEADLRIAVTHHPFDWLTEADRTRVEKLLKKECDFILHGHNHTPNVKKISDTDGEYVIIPAGACYDRRTPSDTSSVNAYNFVHLADCETGQGVVYLRRWNNDNSEWRKDTNTYSDGEFPLGKPDAETKNSSSSFDSNAEDEEPASSAKYSFDNPPFSVPYREKGEGVVGREEALKAVRRQLSEGRKSSIGQTAAFQGIGGLGKTQLAVEYAYKYRDQYPNGVIWIIADQEIDPQLISLAKEADWISPKSEHKIILDAAKQRLKRYSDCLIIFDNVEDQKYIEPYFPSPQANPHILITSRASQAGFEPVELKLLNPHLSLDLLMKESEREFEKLSSEDQDAAGNIAEKLDGLPLAIEIAGAYLRRFNKESFQTYLEFLDSNLKTALNECKFDSFTKKHKESFYATLQVRDVVFEEAPHLKEILDLLVWSGSGPMGISPMSTILDKDKFQLSQSLNIGSELRLLTKEPEKESYEIHRLLGQVRREQSPLPKNGKWVEQVCLRLGDWFQDRRKEFNDLPKFEAESNHLEQWLKLAKEYAPAQIARLTWLQSYPFHHRGKYHNSHKLVKDALQQFDNIPNGDSELKAHILNDLSATYDKLGKSQKILEYNKQAFNIRLKKLGKNNQDTSFSLANIGGTYNVLGKYEKALEYYRLALEKQQELLGNEHPDTARSLDGIGLSYNNLGKYKKSLEYYKEALESRQQMFGNNHPDTATSLNNIGAAYANLGIHKKSLKYYEQALKSRKQMLGDNHPDTANSINNIGYTYSSLGEHQKALEYHEKALKIRCQVLGNEHPETANSIQNIVYALADLGEIDQALKRLSGFLARIKKTNPSYSKLAKLEKSIKQKGTKPGFRPPGSKSNKPNKKSGSRKKNKNKKKKGKR